MKKPTLLIVVGPQGSGNHMWSKLLSAHPDVSGWDELQDEVWLGHDNEPFAKYWRTPVTLEHFDFSSSDYWVTSISAPYFDNGVERIPDITTFIGNAIQLVDIKVAMISRDVTILESQQNRLRDRVTLPELFECTEHVYPDIYLSFETLHLYGSKYLKHISSILQFPVEIDQPALLEHDSNKKYITGFESDNYWLDDLAKVASSVSTTSVSTTTLLPLPAPITEAEMGQFKKWWNNIWREEYEIIINASAFTNNNQDLHFSAKKLIKTTPKHFIFTDMKDQRNEIKFLEPADFHIIKIW